MTRLHLSKENFKFSSAHFLIFDEHRAERLHGHNYRVKVDIAAADSPMANGFLINFTELKPIIKKRLDEWDEYVLLPRLHPDMKIELKEPGLHVHFRDRYYVFPANEVVLLPVNNTSVEHLSQLLAEDFLAAFKPFGVTGVTVYVEESSGQGASSSAGAI